MFMNQKNGLGYMGQIGNEFCSPILKKNRGTGKSGLEIPPTGVHISTPNGKIQMTM